MTNWEKETMSTAQKDCLRVYKLDTTTATGWSEYGMMLLDYESTETLTDDNGKAKINLIKVHSEEEDAIAPLPCGSFMRIFLYGDLASDGSPIWQFKTNGEPENFRNYYITSGTSRWFEFCHFVSANRYKHEYDGEEIIACLKDYPIRSTKTFAEGEYAFRECLEIAFELAFRPRSVGSWSFAVKPFSGLDEPNSKLEYTNSTLYDVVTDIARIIDAIPSMEINYVNGKYVFELYFTDRYGLEGNITDISYFNQKHNSAITCERDTNAGMSISNVENLKTSDNRYPLSGGQKPIDTNPDGNYGTFIVPYPIDEVASIEIYTDKTITNASGSITINFDDGRKQNVNSFPIKHGKLTYLNPLRLSANSYAEVYSESLAMDRAQKKRLFLKEYEEYRYLLKDSGIGLANEPTQDKTIYYIRGTKEIHLDALFTQSMSSSFFNGVFIHYGYAITGSGSSQMRNELYYSFAKDPDDSHVFGIAITYKPMISATIKGVNSKPSDVTVFFNQYGQVVDIEAFGNAVNNYTKTMNGESRVVAHYYYPASDVAAMYEEMPEIGSSVIDAARNKRYVITMLSFTRKSRGGQYLAYLTESRAGKSRSIIANNSQTIYAIPDKNVVTSKSHTLILCRLGLRPFDHVPSKAVKAPYLFNAFLGNNHSGDKKPKSVNLNITTKEGNISQSDITVFNSRIRLGALMSFQFMTNSVIKISDGTPMLYTDSKGQLDSIKFQYKNGDDTLVEFLQMLKKDAYEIMNHTTQVSWVEYGNIRIGESLVNMSYFGDGDGLDEPLQLVLLSSRMRLDDSVSGHIAARYNVTFADSGNCFSFTISGLSTIPEHMGWAIARGDKVIVLDNFDKIVDNIVRIYYDIEVKD